MLMLQLDRDFEIVSKACPSRVFCVFRLQKVKQDLMTTATISRRRRQKLVDSLAMLTHDAEREKSFASKAARGRVFGTDVIDVNTAFTLTNQIKLARVFEMTLKTRSLRHVRTFGVDAPSPSPVRMYDWV